MKRAAFRISIVATVICLALSVAVGSSNTQSELIGTWNYTSITVLEHGKPSSIVHLEPGQWTVTFKTDSTWFMKAPYDHSLNGTYEVHGQDLKMKLITGRPYDSYHFTLEQDAKSLVLTAKDCTISASRE